MHNLVAFNSDSRLKDRTCCYNKTDSNMNSNFTNEVQILEKKTEFKIPSCDH